MSRLLERILFALVAGRALAPSSKLEATRWIREEVHIAGLAEVDHTSCYRAMDWLLEHLGGVAGDGVLRRRGPAPAGCGPDLLRHHLDLLRDEFEDGELDGTDEGLRKRGHSKDSRPDLPQVVIGMAVTTGGLPVKLWVWPGDTQDQTVLTEVKEDLAGWRLNRTVWVVDAGFTSQGQPQGPDRWRVRVHHRGEAARQRSRHRRGTLPAGPVPHRRRAPAGQGHPGR
jgi:hypothetical protein